MSTTAAGDPTGTPGAIRPEAHANEATATVAIHSPNRSQLITALPPGRLAWLPRVQRSANPLRRRAARNLCLPPSTARASSGPEFHVRAAPQFTSRTPIATVERTADRTAVRICHTTTYPDVLGVLSRHSSDRSRDNAPVGA